MGPGDNVDMQDTDTDSTDADNSAVVQSDYGNVMFNVGDTAWGVVDAQDDVVVFNPLAEP